MIHHQAGAILYELCGLMLCGIFLFLRFGVELGYCGFRRFWRYGSFTLSLANFELHLFLVDVVVDCPYKLRAGLVFIDRSLHYGECGYKVERFQAFFSIDLVDASFFCGKFLIARLHGGQVFGLLAFKIFEVWLESAFGQGCIADVLETCYKVFVNTGRLVLIKLERVRVFGNEFPER